jgi:hypothetical protein
MEARAETVDRRQRLHLSGDVAGRTEAMDWRRYAVARCTPLWTSRKCGAPLATWTSGQMEGARVTSPADAMTDVRPLVDRWDAGLRLAGLLPALRGQDVLVLGIARGGAPVRLRLPVCSGQNLTWWSPERLACRSNRSSPSGR